jgi:hypothetical protein
MSAIRQYGFAEDVETRRIHQALSRMGADLGDVFTTSAAGQSPATKPTASTREPAAQEPVGAGHRSCAAPNAGSAENKVEAEKLRETT